MVLLAKKKFNLTEITQNIFVSIKYDKTKHVIFKNGDKRIHNFISFLLFAFS